MNLDTVEGEDGKHYPASEKAAEQKREAIRDEIEKHPEKSDRQIAGDLGVSNKTVSTVRHKMEDAGEVCNLHTSIGTDGKEYPRKRKAPDPEDIPEEDETPGGYKQR